MTESYPSSNVPDPPTTFRSATYAFDGSVDRRNTGSLKWDHYRDLDVVPMWVADMDFQSPREIIEAIQHRAAHGVFGYTHQTPELNQVVCKYLSDIHQVEIDEKWILWLPGCVPALSMACGCVGGPGDYVLTCTPVYPPFLVVHLDSGRNLTKVPLATDETGRPNLDWSAIERATSRSTKVVLFCNPQNPVGRVFSRNEVERLGKFCVDHDLVLCSDEIHCDLILEPGLRHVSVLSMPAAVRDRSITLMAASKTYNIAGLACAFAVVPNADLRRQFRRAAGKMLPEISPFSFVATEAAYRFGDPWRQALIDYLRRNRDLLHETVARDLAPVSMTPVEATYLAWLDVRKLHLSSPRSYFEQYGVGLSDGADFGAPGFVRLNFGCPAAQLQSALNRMKIAVAAAHSKEISGT